MFDNNKNDYLEYEMLPDGEESTAASTTNCHEYQMLQDGEESTAASTFDNSINNDCHEYQTLQDGEESTTASTMNISETAEPTAQISYRQHSVEVLKLTYPIILSELFQNTLTVMDIGFVGRLSKQDLAAAGLATAWFNIWNCTMLGFMTAIDTLLAQSYGANQAGTFSMWTGNSLVIVFSMTFIMSGAIALCGPAMRLFGQDPELADAAGEFSYRLIPGLFPYCLFKVLTKYMQTQDHLAPGVWIGVLANVMNALFAWSLIFTADWGLMGAPWATSLTRLVEFLLIVAYMFMKKNSLEETWPTFSRKNLNFEVLKPFWKLGVSGALSFALNEWFFEISAVLAGLLGPVALDAHIIVLTIDAFIYLSFPFAIGLAASIRVGQIIGDQKPKDAQRSSLTSLCMSAGTQAILIIILWWWSKVLGNLMSSDEEVAHLVSQLVPILCVYLLGDSVMTTTSGVLRGLGKQTQVVWLNMIGFWMLAVPIGVILTFAVGLGVFGLWWGMVIGIYGSSIFGLWFVYRVDWNHIIIQETS